MRIEKPACWPKREDLAGKIVITTALCLTASSPNDLPGQRGTPGWAGFIGKFVNFRLLRLSAATPCDQYNVFYNTAVSTERIGGR